MLTGGKVRGRETSQACELLKLHWVSICRFVFLKKRNEKERKKKEEKEEGKDKVEWICDRM